MRLTDDERQSIILVSQGFAPHGSVLKLYGSRTDDEARGGDVDLVLIVPQASQAHAVNWLQWRVALQTALGEQKFDVSAVHQPERDPFWRLALLRSCELARY